MTRTTQRPDQISTSAAKPYSSWPTTPVSVLTEQVGSTVTRINPWMRAKVVVGS